MSHTSAFEGTLLVNPLLQLATAYYLLRPFFVAKTLPPAASSVTGKAEEIHTSEYLSPENWKLESPMSSWVHGANLGRGQELNSMLHPHLNLPSTMVSSLGHLSTTDFTLNANRYTFLQSSLETMLSGTVIVSMPLIPCIKDNQILA